MKEFIQKLLDRAKQEGLTADCYLLADDSISVNAQGREQTGYEANSTQAIGFRVLYNGKMGYASTEAFDDAAIEMLLKSARESAELSELPDEQFIYEGAKEYPILDLPKHEMPDANALFAVTPQVNDAAHAYSNKVDKVAYSTAASSKVHKIIANTYGLYLEEKDCVSYAYASVQAKESEEVQDGFEVAINRDFQALDIESMAKIAAQKALDNLGGQSIESGEYPVVLDSYAMNSLLGVFFSVFSADAAQKGLSLLANKEGEPIASPAVRLLDDPHRRDALQSHAFDDEGVPTTRKYIIENGQLNTLLHNLKTAHKAGVESTGNAGKAGVSGEITITSFNLHFEPGTKSLEELLSSIGDGLVITDLMGLHAGANPISGDFSLAAKGYLFKDGKRVQPVSQITVAGNFYSLLKQIEEFATDLKFFFGRSGSPSCYVGKLSVAGK